ncbi:hypothetical protein OG735_38660 [Streptomyces sp. NBC_01210]|uniref:hypothetical protein n=1 Tax=Streptomyces sp. NBC_01210 TaxID=2903774 RepID=UPI002E1583EC|nr:hypothetical protein OG735_38660 [Streptomyces sp. NBC_01210]
MEIFATVIVLLAMIAVGVLAIQLFTTRHDDRIATLPPAVPGRRARIQGGPPQHAARRADCGGSGRGVRTRE